MVLRWLKPLLACVGNWRSSKEKELVWELDAWFWMQVLACQESQFVGILAWCWDTDGAWPVPVQMAHFEGQPGKRSNLSWQGIQLTNPLIPDCRYKWYQQPEAPVLLNSTGYNRSPCRVARKMDWICLHSSKWRIWGCCIIFWPTLWKCHQIQIP